MDQIIILLYSIVIGASILVGFIWLFRYYGIDRLRHPEEWKDKGSSGERILFKTLINKMHIPKNQILRNVYIPTIDGKTSEIDLIVISKKGLLVFECKNYAGNIYGDTQRKKWVQYIGKKKNYFYNPFMQNHSHVKHLKNYLKQYGNVPIIPMVSTIKRGTWKIKNLSASDYLLGYNNHLKNILSKTPDSELMTQYSDIILTKLRPLSRPDESIQEKHIDQINNK